jgi:hypothetical protein
VDEEKKEVAGTFFLFFIQVRSASKGKRDPATGQWCGFPRWRVGLAWEPLFIQARSASKGIRTA